MNVDSGQQAISQLHFLPGLNDVVAHYWFIVVWQDREIRPDHIIKYVILECLNRFGPGIEFQRIAYPVVKDTVEEQRQTGHMIDVRVSKENASNFSEFFESEITNTGPRIDRSVIIDEYCCSLQPGANTAAATEYLDVH